MDESRRSSIQYRIRYALGRDLPPRAWKIIDEHLGMGNLEYFLELESDPRCYACYDYPRHSPSVQMCTECDKGRRLEEDVKAEFDTYMNIIYPLLYAEN